MTLTDHARTALREAYSVQSSDEAAKAHARRVLTARGHDEAASAKAVDAAFSKWFSIQGAV